MYCVYMCMYIHVYRYGALSSLEGLVQYLGLHTSPADATFCPDHRAQLCYVAHVIAVVLKNSVPSSDGQTNVQVHTMLFTMHVAFHLLCTYAIHCMNIYANFMVVLVHTCMCKVVIKVYTKG